MAVFSFSSNSLPLPAKATEDALANYYGLPQYVRLDELINNNSLDVSVDENFQRTFNSLYRVRRPSSWRQIFYALFQQAREESLRDFSLVLRMLYEATGYVETSFVSKMLATLDPSLPIWDSRVVKTLNASGCVSLGVPANCPNATERLRIAESSYEGLLDFYRLFQGAPRAQGYLSCFDALLPRYTQISDTKKIDCLLWGATTGELAK